MKTKNIALFFVIIFVVYGFLKVHDIFFGSKFSYQIKPKSNLRISVVGNAKHSRDLMINGEKTTINLNGDFEYEFIPMNGLNVLTIQNKDSFGKIKEKTYSFVYKNSEHSKTAQR
jgi:hypothetical protein